MATRRTLVIAALFVVCGSPVLAADTVTQPETVTVESDSPVGLWKIAFPQSFNFHPLGTSDWGPVADQFCQIEKMHAELTVHCLGLHAGGRDVSLGSLRITGNHIRMTWGSMLTYLAINGTFQSATRFDGTMSANHLGISADAPNLVTGIKLSVAADTPDKGGKSALLARLLEEMSKGAVTVPLAAPVLTDGPAKPGLYIKILKPDTLTGLGAIQSIIYLGEGGGTPPSSIYDVEFANGHLICGLHQGADDRLDSFDCG